MSTKDSLLVSIITPHKNRIKYLGQCIESVLNQNYQCIEHIVVDGCSTDGTLALLKEYKEKYPDKFYFVYEQDKGAGEAWNKGLRMARGDIIGWLGSDDMLHGQDAVRAVVQFFRTNPDAKFVHGGCNFVSENGEFLYTHKASDVTEEELLNITNSIACPSAYYRREVVEIVGPLDEYGNDFDYMIRIAKKYHIHSIQDILSNFRIHGNSETGNLDCYLQVLKKDYLVMRRYGGGIFSKRARRYYVFKTLQGLGLTSIIPFLKKLKKLKTAND